MPDAAATDASGLPADPDAVRAIRAALLAEEVPVFDADFRLVMAEAADALDLTPVLDFLRHWGRIADSTVTDPTGHMRMLAYAADHAAGRPVPVESWDAVKARLGL